MQLATVNNELKLASRVEFSAGKRKCLEHQANPY